MRLDETHVGFYVADVVGHGMPAALLTMFIKKALQTKRILGSGYDIVPPHAAMAELNTDICEQNLSSCHFCTAVYAVLDVTSLVLTYSRAGHPEPILVHRAGNDNGKDIYHRGHGELGAELSNSEDTTTGKSATGNGPEADRMFTGHTRAAVVEPGAVLTERLGAAGPLLGIFPEERFTAASVQLRPGDRLLLYTDGLEEAIRPPQAPRGLSVEVLLNDYLLCPRDEMLLRLNDRMDAHRGGRPLSDDVTALVLDIESHQPTASSH